MYVCMYVCNYVLVRVTFHCPSQQKQNVCACACAYGVCVRLLACAVFLFRLDAAIVTSIRCLSYTDPYPK